jgi:hypothetical protein
MAKKKTAAKKKASTRKRTTRNIKAAAKKKTAKKKTAKTAGARGTKKKVARKSSSSRGKSKIKLGRPKVTGEEKLFMLFHENYHARQIFEFLRVETVKELETYSPDEIIRLLSAPIAHTVRKIRETLADKNRHLAGDIEFAADYQQKKTT